MTVTRFLASFATRSAENSQRREPLLGAALRFALLLSPSESRSSEHAGVAESRVAESRVAESRNVTLVIASGLHRGATLELCDGAYLIGSDANCDIVLRDKPIAPRHCVLTLEASGLSLRDLRGDAPQLLSPQSVAREHETLRSVYDIGGVLVTLAERAPPSRSKPKPALAGERGATRLLPGVLVAGLVLTAIGWAAVYRLAERPAADVAGRATVSRMPAPADLIDEVRDTLGVPGLQITFDGHRMQIAGETRDPAVKNRVRLLMQELKGVVPVDDRVAYVDERAKDAGPLPLRIRDVMTGSPGYFRTDSGARYFNGAILPDGAEVLSIESTRIRFRREGRVITYDLE
jgi:Inner membrane component of T3SS, cytoplasmic domain